VDRRIRWYYTTTILRLRIGARLTRYRHCKFHNFARTISRHADGISRYSVPPSAGPLLPLLDSHLHHVYVSHSKRPTDYRKQCKECNQNAAHQRYKITIVTIAVNSNVRNTQCHTLRCIFFSLSCKICYNYSLSAMRWFADEKDQVKNDSVYTRAKTVRTSCGMCRVLCVGGLCIP